MKQFEKEPQSNSKLQNLLSNKEDIPPKINQTNFNIFDKMHSETFSLILFSLSMIFYGTSGFLIKLIKIGYGDIFSVNVLLIMRSFAVFVCSLSLIKYKNIRIVPVSEVQNQFWFYSRLVGYILALYSYVFILSYMRLSTAQSIVSMVPIVILIINTFILKEEKFHIRYAVGILICFIGTLLIVSNENKSSIQNENENGNNLHNNQNQLNNNLNLNPNQNINANNSINVSMVNLNNSNVLNHLDDNVNIELHETNNRRERNNYISLLDSNNFPQNINSNSNI